MKTIPDSHKDLLNDNKKAFAYLATIMDNGTPQVTPVWFNFENEHLLVNTAEGRIKDRNMRARKSVAIAIADPDDPYRYLQLRGRVIDYSHEGADAHIDQLSNKYTGKSRYQWRKQGEKRIKFKILVEHVDAH